MRLTPVQQRTIDRLVAAHDGYITATKALKALRTGGPIRRSSIAHQVEARHIRDAHNYGQVLQTVGHDALREWPALAPLLAPIVAPVAK